jgi:hypothetical protein
MRQRRAEARTIWKMFSLTSESQMLEELSGQPATEMEYQEFSLRRGMISLKDMVSPEYCDAALLDRVKVFHLRKLVDEWLDSGKNCDGELPSDRNLFRAPAAHKAFDKCADRDLYKPVLFPGLKEPLMVVGGKGAGESGIEDPFDKAERIFMDLMFAHWKNLLCKCRDRRCSSYFLNGSEISRRRKHGIFCCPEHQRRTSAVECTTERREKEEAELITMAAEGLLTLRGTNSSWQSDAEFKRKLADLLNERIRMATDSLQMRSVKVNWVSLHAGEIDRARRLIDRARRLQVAAQSRRHLQ